MPGLTQQDVTPVVPQEEGGANEEKEEQGYQPMRWLTNPGNELKFLDKQLVNFVNRMNGEEGGKKNSTVIPAVNPRLGAVRIYEKEDEPGEIRQGSPLMREPFQGVVEATANVGLAGVNLGQNIVEQVAAPIQGREPEPQDPEETFLGRPLADLKEASANFLDVPQRYELDPADRMFRDLSGEVGVSLALAWLIGKTPLNPMSSSTSFTGTQLNPLVSPGLKDLVNTRGPLAALFRTKNAARLRPFLRWSSAIGVESMLTTALVDNRENPFRLWADSGDDQTRAALKALIPQAGLDFALAGGIFGIGKGVEKAFQLPELFQSIGRNNKSHNTVNDVGQARTWAEESGLQQRNGEGSYEFIADDPWGTGPVGDAEVSSGFNQPNKGAAPPKNPREAINQMVGSGDRDIPDVWDASLPEVDVAIRGLDQLDDEGLTAIANRPPEQPIAEALGEQLNRQQQMRQAQEQLRQVAEARSQQRGFGSDVVDEAPAAPEAKPVAEASAVDPAQPVIPNQDMFEAIDVPQLQGIASLDANVGAELAKAGTSPTKATRRELIDAILTVRQKNLGTISPVNAPPSAMPAAQRNEVKKQVIRQAINEGQVRPSATEAPELPTPTKKDLDDMTPFEALDEELRLKSEYQKLDNAKAERIINETREAEGYRQMSPEEQVANGKLDGWEEPSAPAAKPEFAIPKDLSKSAPRFGMAQLKFESDLDRAAYMLRDKAKKSKGEDRMIAALKEQGYDIDEIRALGNDVKVKIQDSIQEATGTRRAPQEAMTIEVPRSELSSIDLPDVPKRAGGDLPMEERLSKAVNIRVEQLETDLKGIAKQVFGDDLPDFKFRTGEKRTIASSDWGGDGTTYTPQSASYSFGGIQDLITINNLSNRSYAELRSSMFHESWHRIQRGYLKIKELKVLDNVFAQKDLANFANLPSGYNIKQIEVQAVAFQNYSQMRDRGETRMDLIRNAMAKELETAFPGFKGWQKKFTVEALTAIAEGWERIRGFTSRAKNLIDGNGYQNVYDLFEQAYDGRLTKNRRFEDAVRTVDEVMGMTDAQVEDLVATGNIKEVDASLDAAIARGTHFNKWRGKANTVLNSIDTEIAALKKLATEGGC